MIITTKLPESNVGGNIIPDPPIKTAGTVLPFVTGKKWCHKKHCMLLKLIGCSSAEGRTLVLVGPVLYQQTH